MRTALEPAFTLEGVESGVRVVSYGGSNQVKVTTNYMVNSTDLATDELVENKLQEVLKQLTPPPAKKEEKPADPKQPGGQTAPKPEEKPATPAKP